jgi:hypothetical protein
MSASVELGGLQQLSPFLFDGSTLLAPSSSRDLGRTGWRLGVIALHEDSILAWQPADLPDADRVALPRRHEE